MPDGEEARPPLLLIFAITATGITGNTLVAPVIPDLVDGLGASRSLAGLVLSAATLPGIALAPVIGLLADRFGRREVLAPCLALFGVAGALAGLAPNFWVLIVARFLQGAGSAGLVNLAVVLIGDNWDGTERATVMGRNSAVLTVGVAVLPPLGGGLAELGGFRAPFVIYPVSLITAWAVLRYLPRTPRSDVRIAERFRGALPYLREPGALALFATAAILFVTIFGVLLTVLPLYLQDTFGMGAGLRGVLLGLPAITATVVALNLGRITARRGRRGVVRASLVVYAVALAALTAGASLIVIVPALLVFGAGEGLLLPTLQDAAAGHAPTESRGTVVATFVSAARFGQTVGPIGASAMYDDVGARATFAAGGVLLTAALATIAPRAVSQPDASVEPRVPQR
ncbi:MAG: MFS transporter [Actinobacteria bacterium]|nr:MFS transporter [Actinomycetota bacterium]